MSNNNNLHRNYTQRRQTIQHENNNNELPNSPPISPIEVVITSHSNEDYDDNGGSGMRKSTARPNGQYNVTEPNESEPFILNACDGADNSKGSQESVGQVGVKSSQPLATSSSSPTQHNRKRTIDSSKQNCDISHKVNLELEHDKVWI